MRRPIARAIAPLAGSVAGRGHEEKSEGEKTIAGQQQPVAQRNEGRADERPGHH